MSHTFYIENLGCFKNQVDAEYMITSLQDKGYTRSESPEKADLILVNSCTFIESAKKESIEAFFQLRQARKDAKIVMTGCMAERYGKELLEMIPEADGIFGNRDPQKIADIADQVMNGEKTTYFPPNMRLAPRRKHFLSLKNSVYVKISEGCSNACTFCAIPKFRGTLSSRTFEDVATEIEGLIDDGVKEINLIAQDLASFGLDRGKSEFIDLIERILKKPGDYWLRMLYLYPDRFPEEVLSICQRDKRLLPYFDLPFQHASGRLLKLMGRQGNAQEYLDLIARIRREVPDAVIRSTFIVGFPGERDSDFQELVDFQKAAKIDWMGVFTYSHEEGTPSYRMTTEDAFELSRPNAEARKMQLEDAQNEITAANLDQWVGRELDVLIEEPIQKTEMALGRSFLQAQEVDGLIVVNGEGLEPGQVVRARIVKRNGVDLEAQVL
ncbi:MAG: 30S ribosomal protein S12 methylthiotransferase RimO [Spirochaetales bacterium]